MQGDFSRWTFDSRARFRSVLLQQGRVLLDADWNEQAQITAHHDETRARDAFGRAGVPMEVEDSFRITDKDGKDPAGTPWGDLRITNGRMYVDGVLIEAHERADGITLGDQPDLPAIGDDDPGLDEPTEDGRYALYVEVRTHHVTMDEAPTLREPALGGPDTTTRARTIGQVKWARAYNPGTTCRDLRESGWKVPEQGTMTPALKAGTVGDDPCALTSEARYTRLENQLYRVQVHQAGASPTFLWSRENGSVTAVLRDIDTTGMPAGKAVLSVDREGRDASLSIAHGDVVEITSTAWQLRGRRGKLAKAVQPDGRRIPVVWLDGGTDLAALGSTPIVRRWESAPLPAVDNTPTDLEGGICVTFKDVAKLRTGDYWLITARSARLAFGLADEAGTLLPVGIDAAGTPRKPDGPQVHAAPLAMLERKTVGGVAQWTLESDCRSIAPSLTQQTTLNLVGGDGQAALPGRELPGAIRVVVRNGDIPVPHTPVLFTPKGGTIRTKEAVSPHPADNPVLTDQFGVAEVWWTLNAAGAHAQTLEVQRLDSAGEGTDVKVVVNGCLSKAVDIGWTAPEGCTNFSSSQTVQKALEWLVGSREVRLLGGDGQYLPTGEKVLPQRIRVIVDSPCGPVKGEKVRATASSGGFVKRANPNDPRPTSLNGGLTSDTADTESDGGAAFWWQPTFVGAATDTLELRQEVGTARAPIVVTAQPGVSFKHREGMHITDIHFTGDEGEKLKNDHFITLDQLENGITVKLDHDVEPHSVMSFTSGTAKNKPVVRVVLEIRYPNQAAYWGFMPVTIEADLAVAGNTITWTPETFTWGRLTEFLAGQFIGTSNMLGRFQMDGWAIMSKTGNLHLNGHANARLDGMRTVYGISPANPTDDQVTGGRFEQWFWLVG
ncbi:MULTISPECIES: DUF6519 domain-containing protein [Streptomyces]|uniref:DUF6519 domain-containing protein n=1 Tax=Streptomyces TaxID=1883 RepID=UPI000CF2D605|nr:MULTISPECIES: DUF6519 domain-containing protein [Streptomyces]PPS67830.1 hypothetical protein BV882_35920 [Streptomyces sp. 46]